MDIVRFIVELEPGVWTAEWSGDPGRTLVRNNAKRFKSKRSARTAINSARRYRVFENAKVVTW